MNEQLEQLAREIDLTGPSFEPLRLAFGYACAVRVRHLLEEPAVVECLTRLGDHVNGGIAAGELERYADEASHLASRHPGSKSIDGCGHAAVSATFAVANALAGRAMVAADYAVYAIVYGEGGYGAVADPSSFEAEHRWQVDTLAALHRGLQRR